MTHKKTNISSFDELGLSPEILQAIAEKGFTTPSPIQAGVIPLLLNGNKDIIGQAQTGTGKTAAFALPLLEKLDAKSKKIQAIVLTPTRELAIQVAAEIQSFAVKNSPSVKVIYGGNNIRGEIAALKNKPTIIVGTPGRVQHHLRTNTLSLESIQYFVLDEADEMLNFGFRSEIESILDLTPKGRRVLLFSATMPKSIMDIVNNYMGDHDTVKVASKEMTNENINQTYYLLQSSDKFNALCRIIEVQETFYAIIFCRTKREVDDLTGKLKMEHIDAEAIHGDIDQKGRERILHRFKTGHTKILVATDVAARGIDVPDLNFVINYTIPESYETYTHRIGRTGRAGNKGTAITLVSPDELNRLKFFERSLKTTFEKGVLPEAKDIILKKQQHLIEQIEHIINNENLEFVLPMAQKLLEEGNAEKVVAALLKITYAQEFDESSYSTIATNLSSSASETKPRVYRSGGRGRSQSVSSNTDSTNRAQRKYSSSSKPSRGGRVGGGSAKKFSTGTATSKPTPRKKYAAKPRNPDQYAGSKSFVKKTVNKKNF